MKKTFPELDEDDRALMDELRGALDAYAVPPAPAGAKEKAARQATALLRERPPAWASLAGQLRIQARFLPWWYYAASALLCVAGVAMLKTMSTDDAARVGMVIGMSPLPALLGLMELFHGADEGMGEIESACLYSPARVLSARMLIVGLISAAIAATIGAASGVGNGWMASGIVVAPFCAGAALGLLLSAMLRGHASSAQVALAIALTNLAAALAATAGIRDRLIKIPPAGWALIMAVSVLALGLVLKAILSEHSKLMERKLLQ